MRNPDKESKKAPQNAGTINAPDEKTRLRGKCFVITTAALLFVIAMYYVFGSSEAKAEETGTGLNTETPHAGDVKIGRTKRENVEIAGEYDRRRESQDKASSSSFDWYDNDLVPAGSALSPDGGTHTMREKSDEQKLADAIARSEAIASSMNGGASASASGKKSGSSGVKKTDAGVSTRGTSSSDYVASREAELRRQQDEQIRRLEEIAAGGKTGKKEEVKKTDEKKLSEPLAVVDKRETQKGFFGLDGSSKAKSGNIRAVVHGEHKNLHSGATVKMRLLDNIKIGDSRVPKNTFVYGVLSFSGGRAQIRIENINLDNTIIPFGGVIYDKDGFEGIYVPDNVVDDATRKAGSDAISAVNLNVSSASSLVNSGVNAVTGAVKSAVSGSVREEKITISTNYQLTIKQKI